MVVEDRIEKEKSRRKVDQEAREIAAAVKVKTVCFFYYNFFFVIFTYAPDRG